MIDNIFLIYAALDRVYACVIHNDIYLVKIEKLFKVVIKFYDRFEIRRQ